MNRDLYRVVFSKALGVMVVASELGSAQGKGRSGSNRSPHRQQPAGRVFARLTPLSFATLVALGAVMLNLPMVQAAIVADHQAPQNQQPTILNTANGLPLVNIQTPSAAGVSRNTYSQFDVQHQGAILNNARTNTSTQLGGWVQGNPWLANGSARVILNEVNSANPSHLNGYVEVAGQRAEVVIANPAGISIDGGGFLNASRATLTTGTPILNGGNLDGYRVQGGTISVTGAGLDASRTDYTDLIARAVQVNAGIWAHQLEVTTGANHVDTTNNTVAPITGTGAVPTVSIDVAQLGGMYAGKITLVGTEAGVGVRNAGNIGATAGELVLTANGQLENSGQMSSTAAVHLDANGNIQNTGTIYSAGTTDLSTQGDITNQGVIAAQGDTHLAANGSQSQVIGQQGSVLGAGIQADGSLGTGGSLTVSATQAIADHGKNLTGSDQRFNAGQIDLTNGQSKAANLQLDASQGDINLSGATLVVDHNLSAHTGKTLRTDHAKISGDQLDLHAHDLSNVQGDLVQIGSGDLTLNLPGEVDNSGGRIASNSQNLNLTAAKITNSSGQLQHAGTGTFTLATDTLKGQGGRISSNGQLNLKAGTVTLDGGTTVAQQLKLDSSSLSNRGGTLVQTGSGAGSITTQAGLDNTDGSVSSNGATTLTVGSLDNQGGTIQAAGSPGADLTITTAGGLDNSQSSASQQGGHIGASGAVHLTAQTLNNTQGQVTADQGLTVNSIGNLTNSHGLLAANGLVSLTAGQIDNSQGNIGSVHNQTDITATAGDITNSGGQIAAAQHLQLSGHGVTNAGGLINGSSLGLNSQTLDNGQGKLVTTGATDNGALTIQSGAVTNDQGLIQAKGTLRIDTQGQTLTNTHSAAGQGIIGQSDVHLSTGALDNAGGFVGSVGDFTVVSSAIGNVQGGVLTSSGQMNLTGQALDNRGGQIQALGNVDLTLSDVLDNTGSLVRSGQTLNAAAARITNVGTQGSNQGLEGQSVNLTAPQIDNTSGSIRADKGITLTSGGVINNNQGLISGQQTVRGNDLNPAQRTLQVTNTDGTMIAGQLLSVDSAGLTGDGKLLSQGDLNVQLNQDFTLTGQFAANGNASVDTGGTLTNQSALKAGQNLTIHAGRVYNTATGEITAKNTTITGTDMVTNRGLIDGQNTLIKTTTVDNAGTGRIYGDHLSIAATRVSNYAENGVAGVIAARNRLDIGAGTVQNQDHALIFSVGDMAIGGSLDANNQASKQADIVNNASATIEALGRLDLAAKQVNNLNTGFHTGTKVVSAQHILEYIGVGSNSVSRSYLSGTPGWGWHVQDKATYLVTPEGVFINWNAYNYTQKITETKVLSSDPSQILSGGAMHVTADHVLNDNSHIIAGGTLFGQIGTLNNTEVSGQRIISDSGTVTEATRGRYCAHKLFGACTNHDYKTNYIQTGYYPADVVQTLKLSSTVYQQNTVVSGSGASIAARSSRSVNQAADGANTAHVAIQHATVGNPITQVAAVKGNTVNGPTSAARNGGVNTAVPNNSLFHVSSSPTARYLVATDSRFTDYRQWVSSDYMLQMLNVDPATTQKRLGDGFYEQRLVEEQVAQLTGRRFLAGYASDETEYKALMNAGLTYAKQWHLVPGVALSAAQMAQLTSDMVWLVDKTITLPDGSTQKVLVPQVYAYVRKGDINGSGSLLSAHAIDMQASGTVQNSGTIAGQSIVSLAAENVKNLGGRITGGNTVALTAKQNIDNIGGTITAGDLLSLQAGRDINIVTTAQSGENRIGASSFSRTGIDQVARLGVENPDGVLQVTAGRDLNLTAAKITNAGTGQTILQAKRDLTLSTITTGQQNNIVWNADNHMFQGNSQDVGSTINTQGNIQLAAGQDIQAKAAKITSGAGAVDLRAGRNISLTSGQASQNWDNAYKTSSHGWFSSSTTTTRDTSADTQSIATALSGASVNLMAGNDLTLQGSRVSARNDIALMAGSDVSLLAGQNTHTESHFSQTSKSGFTSKGYGSSSKIETHDLSTVNNTGSNLHSQQGNIALIANASNQSDPTKGVVQIQGSQVQADAGRVDISGKHIILSTSADTSALASTLRESKSTWAFTTGLPDGHKLGVITDKQQATLNGSTVNGSKGVDLQANGVVDIASGHLNADQGDISITGAQVNIHSDLNSSSASSQETYKKTGANLRDLTGSFTPGKGIGYKTSLNKDKAKTTLATATLNGQNINIQSTVGDITLNAIDATAKGTTTEAGKHQPGTLSLDAAHNLNLASVTTTTSQSTDQKHKDLAWQGVEGHGTVDQTTRYNHFNAEQLKLSAANRITADMGVRDSAAVLAKEPGMGWLKQLQQDPAINRKVDWKSIEEAHQKWDYKQQGLTPAAAAVVAVVVAYFTAGAGTAALGTSATAGGVTTTSLAGTTLATTTATGMTTYATAGVILNTAVTTLASQASVSLINNQGNVGKTLHDLGSSANLRQLATAVVTAGVLNEIGGIQFGEGGHTFSLNKVTVKNGLTANIGKNLVDGLARATLTSAITGTDLQTNIRTEVVNSVL
uniref:two-partner secretion domain-containing protein n=1 Tax=Halothiobacillus sp. TaxID=1891311 RepID=UPI002AD20068